MSVIKYVNHSRKVGDIARKLGWLPGARYTNLRDVQTYDRIGFLDIDWKNYDFELHLDIVRRTKPMLTIACDIERRDQIPRVIEQAYKLKQFASKVAVVPKPKCLADEIEKLIPAEFIFAYSVPTSYGGTRIPPKHFTRPVHLLGG